jgi:hypothetical protein
MMTYEYIDEATEEIIERKFSMHGPIPPTVEQDGKVYRRFYGRRANVLYRASGFKATDTQDLVDKWKHEHLDRY